MAGHMQHVPTWTYHSWEQRLAFSRRADAPCRQPLQLVKDDSHALALG